MSGPLSGIRVVDAGILVQGPQSAAMLVDMGAEVIKVELPGFGDQARFIFLDRTDLRSAYYTACNRGKKSITCDLRRSEGAALLKKLLADADVLITNFKPGTMESWGLGYEDLEKAFPRLIWAAGSTFGPEGPDSNREGADLAAQCAGGLVSTTGRDGDPPSPVGITIADHIASLNLTCGILAALHARQSNGRGQKVEVSLLGGQIWAQASEYTHYLMSGKIPGRSNFGHPLIRAPYRIFQTSNGWIGLIGVPADSRDTFLVAMDLAEVIVDPRMELLGYDEDALTWFNDKLSAAFRTKTTEDWCELLREIGVRYAPVNDYAQATRDKGVWANGYLQEIRSSDGTAHKVVGPPVRLSSNPLRPHATAPSVGEHTTAVLQDLGMSEDEIEMYRRDGIV